MLKRKRIYRLGALAGLVSLGGVIYLHFEVSKQPMNHAPFEISGHTARDVIKALVELDQLEIAPANPTSDLARRAISKAERGFGLPADGMADQTLLDYLMADLAANNNIATAEQNWMRDIDNGKKLIDFLGALIALAVTILGFLGLRRD